MRHVKRLSLAAGMVAIAACIGAGPASATTVCVGGTVTAPCTDGHPGGAFTLTSTNLTMVLPGAPALTCAHTTVSGTAPATTVPTLSFPVTVAFSGCVFGGIIPATVTTAEACHTGSAQTRLKVTWNQATAPQASATVTFPLDCNVAFDLPSINCVLHFTGDESFLGAWFNGTSSTRSLLEVNSSLGPVLRSSGGGFGCPAAGTYNTSVIATFNVVAPTPAPGATVIQ